MLSKWFLTHAPDYSERKAIKVIAKKMDELCEKMKDSTLEEHIYLTELSNIMVMIQDIFQEKSQEQKTEHYNG